MEAAISRSTSAVPSLLPSSNTNRVTAWAARIVSESSSITDRTVTASLWTGMTTASCGRVGGRGVAWSSTVSRPFEEDALVRRSGTVVCRAVPVDRRLEAVSERDPGLPTQRLTGLPDVQGAAHGSRRFRGVEENLLRAPPDEVEDRVRDLDHRVPPAVAEVDRAPVGDPLRGAHRPFDDVGHVREVPILTAVAPDRVRVHPADRLVDQGDDRVGLVLPGSVRGNESDAAPFHPVLADEGQELDFAEDLRPAVLQGRADALTELPRVAVLFAQQVAGPLGSLQCRWIDARGTREDHSGHVRSSGGFIHVVVDPEVRADVGGECVDVSAASVDGRAVEEHLPSLERRGD